MFGNFNTMYLRTDDSRGCSMNHFCWGAVLIFAGSICLCAVGFVIIFPYQTTRNWPEGDCTVLASFINVSGCSCGHEVLRYPTCPQLYPCLQIYVEFTESSTSATNKRQSKGSSQNAQIKYKREQPFSTDKVVKNEKSKKPKQRLVFGSPLYLKYSAKRSDKEEMPSESVQRQISKTNFTMKNGFKLRQVLTTLPPFSNKDTNDVHNIYDVKTKALLYNYWSDIYLGQCTLNECGAQEWNIQENAAFATDWGQLNSTFPCYAKPNDTNIVLLNRTSFWQMFHAALWPSLCLGIGITLWCGLCFGIWPADFDQPPSYGVA